MMSYFKCNILIVLLLFVQLNHFRSHRFFTRVSSGRRNSIVFRRCTSLPSQNVGRDTLPEPLSTGLMSSFDYIEAAVEIEDLGLTVSVGPSLISPNAGRGLFLSINDGVDEVTLPRGTPICGYSKGVFRDDADGDKSVAFYFSSPYLGVIFKKKMMPLFEAIAAIDSTDLTLALEGHKLSFDAETNEILVIPEEEYQFRYFIPEEKIEDDHRPGNIGIYANDLAYEDSEEMTEKVYRKLSNERNVLELVWRLEKKNGRLVPTWPVVVTKKDIRLTNSDPMEVGLQYSWRYWEAVLALRDENKQ